MTSDMVPSPEAVVKAIQTGVVEIEREIKKAKEKTTKARANLVLDQAFFGSLLLKLKLIPDVSHPTMWVNGKELGYSPRFVNKLSMSQLKAVLCHEVLHIICQHSTRQGEKNHRLCNIAGDYAINPMIRDTFDLPEGHLYDEEFEGKSMEEIYTYLMQDKHFLTTPGSPYDYLEAYREVAKWASAIVCLTIPKELSTMFDSAHTAMEMAKEIIPGVSIKVLDCGTLAGAQGLIVLAAAIRAVAGGSLEQVIDAVESARASTGLFFPPALILSPSIHKS